VKKDTSSALNTVKKMTGGARFTKKGTQNESQTGRLQIPSEM
jgi:hypothetical protein